MGRAGRMTGRAGEPVRRRGVPAAIAAILLLGLLPLAIACDGAPDKPVRDRHVAVDETPVDPGVEAVDAPVESVEVPPPECEIDVGAAGCPCSLPEQCDSQHCNRRKGACARTCTRPDDCLPTEVCSNVPGVPEPVCADAFPTACLPCATDDDCLSGFVPGAVSCGILGEASEGYCVPECGAGGACPDGMSCQDGARGDVRICQPDGARCPCTPEAEAAGRTGLQGCTDTFKDVDGDEAGRPGDSRCLCGPRSPYTAVVGDDCNDDDDSIRPGEAELCNARDDNCDSRTDEGLGLADSSCSRLGVCAADGVLATCEGGKWVCDYSAIGDHEAVETLCDQKDNDCDGGTDNRLTGQAGHCPDKGICAALPLTSRCVGGVWECDPVGTPGYEKDVEMSCDDLDNDCDGLTDDEFTYAEISDGALRVLGDTCGTGACASGTVICATDHTKATCSRADLATPESCNDLDDDCDGVTDDGFLFGALPIPSPCTGIGACGDIEGRVECFSATEAGCSTNPGGTERRDVPEVCDRKDNDCNGETDEGLDEGTPRVGECSAEGVCLAHRDQVRTACVGGQTVCRYDAIPSYDAGVETLCDALDNNCDGLTDESFFIEEPAGSGTRRYKGEDCGLGLCGDGTVECGSTTAAACSTADKATAETCNRLDDDCDGVTDDGFEYARESDIGSPVVPVGAPCEGRGECRLEAGVVECLTDTRSECSTNPDGTGPLDVPEICNGLDDDCDGETDEDLVVTADDCHLTGVCAPSLVQAACADGHWACDYSGVGAQYEEGTETSCDNLDNDCDGSTDEDFSFVDWNGSERKKHATCGTGPCEDGTVRCMANQRGLECSSGSAALPEQCDGEDNDCDGTPDEEGKILCSDGLDCTLDACSSGSCEHDIARGYCLILGTCYPNGAFHPTEPCMHCDWALDMTDWSPTNSGGACNADESGCTVGDHCDAGGNCEVGTPVDCSGLDDTCVRGVCVSLGPLESECRTEAANENGVCDDSLSCTTTDRCIAGRCTGAPYSCDDGLACTTDTCDGEGGCTHAILGDHCVIDGTCRAANAQDPANTCHLCLPSASTTSWTVKLDGDPCSDGDACTNPDKCQGGECAGGAPVNCDDLNACTADSCDPAAPDSTQACVHTLLTGSPCSDLQACTRDDTCVSGMCIGEAYACSSPAACVTSSCDGEGGCIDSVNAGFCYIGDSCYAQNAPNPAQGCQYCSPSVSLKEWTKYPNDTTCLDGDACTSGDRCMGGVCTPTGTTDCDDGNPCTTDSCARATGCAHENNTAGCTDGNACTFGDQCSGGVCAPGVPKSCSPANPDCEPSTGTCRCGEGGSAVVCATTSASQCVAGVCKCGENDQCDPAGKNPRCNSSTGQCSCTTGGVVCGANSDTCNVFKDSCTCGGELGDTACSAGITCCAGECCPPGHSCDPIDGTCA